MKSRKFSVSVATVLGAMLLTATPALAQAAKVDEPAQKVEKKALKAGDRAPEFKVEKFVKGEPITGFEKGHVYVVEFWATWCGPCIKAFPHLSELQKQYAGDVTIVGTNVWETQKYNDKTYTKVEDFVAKKGDIMGYTVAYDGASKHMATEWMEAAGQNGIPAAFVVGKQGNVEWIGHPMWLDVVLPEVVGDTWNVESGNAKIEAVEAKLNKAFQSSGTDPAAALATFAEIEKDYPAIGHMFEDAKAGWMAASGDTKGANEIFSRKVGKMIEARDSAGLNEIAWGIVDPANPMKGGDLDLALRAATAADEFTEHKDAMIIDTLARVHFAKGDVAKAIELQTKAVELAPENFKADMTKALEEYKAKK